MSKIEILAPVGNEEMLRAAVFSGADAVYLGFSGFNARTSANNFNADTLKDAVAFCHARGVAVHVALNTTVYGGELPALEQAIRAVAASGADAVICQDLAVATLIGKIAPQLPRHGSTQMSVHSLQGALELKELGFTRVVLARELSMPEVEHITKHCGIETECFVHGALCMCVSGQCYMSAFLGGRSGNRGSCAGPCRLPFEANALPEGKPGRLHHLSLKDNSVIDKLDKLQALGVASAKIEGRLRTPEYVAAAVSACLAGREGRAYDRDLLKNAFSRSGFTSGYLDGKIDGTMFGVRSEADAEQTKKTLPMLRELYRRERSRVPVKMKLEIEEGGEKLTVTDADGSKAFAYGDAEPQPARTDPTESLHRSLAKTGGTPFAVEDQDITVEMDGAKRWMPCSKSGKCCARGPPPRSMCLPCRCAPCRLTVPCVPGLRAGSRCRSGRLTASSISSCPLRRPTACPGNGGQRPFWNCPGSCLASWKKIPPAASRPRRTPVLQAMR